MILLVFVHGFKPMTFGWNGMKTVTKWLLRWRKTDVVPYIIWDSAICEFDTTYIAHLAKVEKNKQGKEDDPSTICKFRFRSKKDS